MRIANIVQDSIVDGPGLRFVVFVQGCSHGCKGCHNPGTHDPAGGYEMSVDEILEMIRKNPLVQGVTISGGEPFDQAEECLELAHGVWEMGLKLWVYTGYTFEQLWTRSIDEFEVDLLLDQIDVLVDGPFIESQKSYDLKWRGSRNQRLIDMQESLDELKIVLWEPSPRDTERGVLTGKWAELEKFEVPES